jgi:hypothetical protein
VARPHVDFNFTEASAPDFDDEASTAPVMMDPNALASAPVYRRSIDRRSKQSSSSWEEETRLNEPSAL